MPTEKYTISFCIVCMNRLHQLKETLMQNVQDNRDYNALEYIILDYNSQDGMEEWVKENMNEYIVNGTMIYYKTYEPGTFSHSHSKNLAFQLAGGEIVCNVNADHYTGPGFARYINEQFKTDNNIVLTPLDFYKTQKGLPAPKDVGGKVCVKKSDFLAIKGFDERMDRYGFEDWDFVNRLELIHIKRVLIGNATFLRFIAHEENERYSLNEANLHGVYVKYCTPSVSEVIILYRDHRFEKGIMIDNTTLDSQNYVHAYVPRNYLFEFSIQEPGWYTGMWTEIAASDVISFLPDNTNYFVLAKSLNDKHEALKDNTNGALYYRLSDDDIVGSVLTFNYLLHNRSLMEENLKCRKPVVNLNGFGKATVFKNFQYHSPINI